MLSTKSRAARHDHGRSAQTPPHYSFAPRFLLAGGLAIALVACAPATVTPSGSGGSNNGGSGGSSNGGSGGSNNGGSGGTSSSGGSNTGGTTAKGGSGGTSNGGSGGTSNGGSGGTNTGGTTAKGGSGGTSNGGSGGTSNGGSGGTSAGGAGGTSAGGAGGTSAGGAGGTSAGGAGGTSAGGAGGTSTGGTTGTGSRPPGYFYTADWNVTKVDWHGCAWTGKDCASNCPTGVTPVPNSTTTVEPVDFMSTKDGGPYQLKGKVGKAYEAVALLGFNINEAIDSAKGATQCKYDPALKDGPPTATMPSGATGIAVNWSATTLPTTFRIQIQGVKGATDPNNRWCATIKEGQKFVPFTDFSTTCWNTTGTKYNNEPIDAVAFLVPGNTTAESPFDITIVGFAPGTSAADAPGPAAACGTRTGTVGQTALQGDATKDKDASSQRAVTTDKDCRTYIVNNNNWGQPTSSYQKLSFTGNSFTVDAMNGTGSSAPASFPSLYVGGNGQTLDGTFVTWENTFPSKQPTAISALGSVNTTFKWSGKSSGDFNTSYDIWFSSKIPTAGSYNDAISGFIMVWLYKPGSRQPIGNVVRQANIGGVEYDVWAGPRGNTSTGTDPAGRPVISYVAKSTVTSFSADLKAFFNDAVSKADSQNGITQTFSSSWYLTDVFAGFEIWSGGAGLKCDEFTVAVK